MHPLHLYLLLTLSLLTTAHHFTLYASSYAGNITTLCLTHQTTQDSTQTTYHLALIYSTPCANDPTWLTLSPSSGHLYCIGEGLAGIKGGLSIYSTNASGQLTPISSTDIGPGAVNAATHGRPKAAGPHLVLANYSGTITTYNLSLAAPPGLNPFAPPPSPSPTPLPPPTLQQLLAFTLPTPGPIPSRQSSPHPHQVHLDPTHQYVLSPDLGADLVRVFRIDNSTGLLHACDSLAVKPGTGARHVAFWRAAGNCTGAHAGEGKRAQRVMRREEHGGRRHRVGRRRGDEAAAAEEDGWVMYVVGELGNTVTGYAVSYGAGGGMGFSEIGTVDTFGGKGVPAGAAAAEIVVKGDQLIVSNRNDSSFATAHSNSSSNPGAVDLPGPSDSLATFAIGHGGQLNFTGLRPAGGVSPRHFSVNKAGDLVAVGLQLSGRVVVIERDAQTGKMGDIVAEVGGLGNVTCVIWDEEGRP